ncbi:MAG: carbamoyltransferase HypF [Candidatus Thorarchaeota archaeon]|nr:MAG: carbamoyltransferase HypF [Candidatus Thorarchaeota archaeon]
MVIEAKVHVSGIVQGVGFRPYIYRLAVRHGLRGYVLNLGDAGVRIVLQGRKPVIRAFLTDMRSHLPSIARIDTLDIEWSEIRSILRSFEIKKSSVNRTVDATPDLPPDIAICDDCVKDLMSPSSRWYHYPFTSCAACGPRFSTITDLPYDRPNTTMIDFPLCDTCNTGYTDPLDRRYHAQTTACSKCGPTYGLFDRLGAEITSESPVQTASEIIKSGYVVAVHGIGGTHIATATTTPTPIRELRRRKRRHQRPFAIMVNDVTILKKFAVVDEFEERLLQSWRRPIVLLSRLKNLDDSPIPEESLDLISPGLDTVGVMLPYAPVHHLLFESTEEPALVMTSANPSGVPMYVTPQEIRGNLREIIDYALIHNRRIHQRADDSVVKLVGPGNPVFIRRARGYVPEPLHFGGMIEAKRVLAVGPEEKATAAIYQKDRVYLTQHIGDTDNVESLDFLLHAIRHLFHLLDIKELDGVAHDLHPEFLSTDLARNLSHEYSTQLVPIQHHHAHLASLLVDRNCSVDTSIVCITADGFGYGSDSTAWGGEILLGDLRGFSRVGGMKAHRLSGGDLSAKYAARSVIGILQNHLSPEEILEEIAGAPLGNHLLVSEAALNTILEASTKHVGTVLSSSAGRFLDAAALLLDVSSKNGYDGECPMKLEAVAQEQSDIRIEPEFVSSDHGTVLDTTESLIQLMDLKRKGAHRRALAYAVQSHLGVSLAELACDVAEDKGVTMVGFSGGVALNHIVTKHVIDLIESRGLKPLIHRRVPPGDGGISVGQVASAVAQLS